MKYEEWIDNNEAYIVESYKVERNIKEKVYLHDVPQSFVRKMYEDALMSKKWYEGS